MKEQYPPNYSDNDNYNRDDLDSLLPPQMQREKELSEIGVIRELSSRKVLETLRMNLKGYHWDYDKKDWRKIEGFEPIMNDKGVSKYLQIISSVVTDLVTFSSYKENEINKLVLFICKQAIPVIYINYQEYGIKSKSDLSIISIQLMNMTLAAFKKAVGAGDRGVIGRTIQENILSKVGMVSERNTAQKGGGFWGSLNPFR